MGILIDLGNMDWTLLRQQKRILAGMTGLRALQAATVEGLLAGLDHIQDEAAKQLGQDVVFGDFSDEEPEPLVEELAEAAKEDLLYDLEHKGKETTAVQLFLASWEDDGGAGAKAFLTQKAAYAFAIQSMKDEAQRDPLGGPDFSELEALLEAGKIDELMERTEDFIENHDLHPVAITLDAVEVPAPTVPPAAPGEFAVEPEQASHGARIVITSRELGVLAVIEHVNDSEDDDDLSIDWDSAKRYAHDIPTAFLLAASPTMKAALTGLLEWFDSTADERGTVTMSRFDAARAALILTEVPKDGFWDVAAAKFTNPETHSYSDLSGNGYCFVCGLTENHPEAKHEGRLGRSLEPATDAEVLAAKYPEADQGILNTVLGGQVNPTPEPTVLYECGICEGLHRWEFKGDCREDGERFEDSHEYAQHVGFDADTYIQVRTWEERQANN